MTWPRLQDTGNAVNKFIPSSKKNMPHFSTIETEFLILRKTNYSETSLIFAGLSPDYGQLHFLARGARRVGRRSFPVADVFRILSVKYHPGKSDLLHWQDIDVIKDFHDVAGNQKIYTAACRLAGFTLKNTASETPAKRYYQALGIALGRLQKMALTPPRDLDKMALAPVICALIVYLDENGLLPDYRGKPGARNRRDALLAAGEGRSPLPRVTPATWQKLDAWLQRTLARHEL